MIMFKSKAGCSSMEVLHCAEAYDTPSTSSAIMIKSRFMARIISLSKGTVLSKL